MKDQEIFEESPGKLLRIFLKEVFLFDENQQSIFKKIDSALRGNNEIHETIYESTINYLLRRLITLSRFLYRKYKDDESLFVKKLRISIENNFNFPFNNSQFEKLITLLSECAKIAERPLKPRTTTNRYKKGGENQRCYICGKTVIDPKCNDQINGATLDHFFPNALGGSNSSKNLKMACAQCNSKKRDMIDSTDFHYESMSLISDTDDPSFNTAMNKEMKIALWGKNNFECSVCNKRASYMGELQLSRINTEDNWHYFNVFAYCETHKK